MADPRTPAPADTPEHQPVVDAFTDGPQIEGERPEGDEVDPGDMTGAPGA